MKQQAGTPMQNEAVELSLRCIVIAVFLTIILAVSNAFLALKIGMLTSASIPAAVISMAILRFFKNPSIFENNLVQTAASAGEAVAGGIVYTIPALIIIHYWYGFSYWENFFIAAIGGTLGVVFSIPLRKILVRQPDLPFPEGRAIAEVLKASSSQHSIKELVIGSGLGALLELFQTGFKVIANDYQVWFTIKKTLLGFGVGFSATMIGAGYLIGFELGLSIFIGAFLGWIVTVPIFSVIYPDFQAHYLPLEAVSHLWNEKVRYLGIGAMLCAGMWSLMTMLKPLVTSIRQSMADFSSNSERNRVIPRTEKDIPWVYLFLLLSVTTLVMFVFFHVTFPLEQLGFDLSFSPTIIFLFVLYVLIVGFIFSVIIAFFSGLVGVTASPGSSVIIAGMLLLGFILTVALKKFTGIYLTDVQIHAAQAITIIVGSVVTGIASIAIDNIQDLKVGHIIGATPWKQQVMLLIGVIVSASIIPPVMQLLFNVYGIAGVMPHAGMDPTQSLPAPPAALMAAITQAIFTHGLPWLLLGSGALLVVILIPLMSWVKKRYHFNLSVLGVAIGIYLPMTSSIPLFIGAVLSLIIKKRLNQQSESKRSQGVHKGLLLACGLLAGAALMDVILAIPFSLAKSANVMQLNTLIWDGSTLGFAVLSTFGLIYLFNQIVCGKQ